jgi:hypothetical protein
VIYRRHGTEDAFKMQKGVGLFRKSSHGEPVLLQRRRNAMKLRRLSLFVLILFCVGLLATFSRSAFALPIINSTGGPYLMVEGNDLFLNASVYDTGSLALQYTWTLNHFNLTFNYGVGLVNWPQIGNLMLPKNQAIDCTLTVKNTALETASSTTQLTIYERQPKAAFTMNPLPISVGDSIKFDGTISMSPDPRQTIVDWRWDITKPCFNCPWYSDSPFDFSGSALTLTSEQSALYFPTPGYYWIALYVQNESGYWGQRLDRLTVTAASVPEPSTLLMLGSGLLGLVGLNRRRKA